MIGFVLKIYYLAITSSSKLRNSLVRNMGYCCVTFLVIATSCGSDSLANEDEASETDASETSVQSESDSPIESSNIDKSLPDFSDLDTDADSLESFGLQFFEIYPDIKIPPGAELRSVEYKTDKRSSSQLPRLSGDLTNQSLTISLQVSGLEGRQYIQDNFSEDGWSEQDWGQFTAPANELGIERRDTPGLVYESVRVLSVGLNEQDNFELINVIYTQVVDSPVEHMYNWLEDLQFADAENGLISDQFRVSIDSLNNTRKGSRNSLYVYQGFSEADLRQNYIDNVSDEYKIVEGPPTVNENGEPVKDLVFLDDNLGNRVEVDPFTNNQNEAGLAFRNTFELPFR